VSTPVPREWKDAQASFSSMVAELRPSLHRYASRMVGSAIDAEDVVQEALARAFYALSQMEEAPALGPWLFRIAHNLCVDHLRARKTRNRLLEADEDWSEAPSDDVPLEQRELAAIALALFLRLPPIPRAAVILKDLLDHSLEEIALELAVSVAAVKSALHRGRASLRAFAVSSAQLGGALGGGADAATETGADAAGGGADAATETGADAAGGGDIDRTLLTEYVRLFNAQEWDALRAMLSADVRVELAGRGLRVGSDQAGDYFGRYRAKKGWSLSVGRAEGRLVVCGADEPGERTSFIVVVRFDEHGRIRFVRDFSTARYVMRELVVAPS
jgi:RNA polymerase sigma-70 factor (ECF subfamily)